MISLVIHREDRQPLSLMIHWRSPGEITDIKMKSRDSRLRQIDSKKITDMSSILDALSGMKGKNNGLNKDPSNDPANPTWLPGLFLGMKHLFEISA